MGTIGVVKDYEVGKNRDGSKDVLLLKVEVSEPDDVQTVEYMSSAGDDSVPEIESRVMILSAGNGWKIAIASQDTNNVDSSLQDGERKIYSTDAGVIKAFITWLKDGQLILNGTGDFAVRFNELETAFNQLKDDLNSFITTKYNIHNHPTAPVGPVSPPTLTGTSSTADISPAKIDTIEVPS